MPTAFLLEKIAKSNFLTTKILFNSNLHLGYSHLLFRIKVFHKQNHSSLKSSYFILLPEDRVAIKWVFLIFYLFLRLVHPKKTRQKIRKIRTFLAAKFFYNSPPNAEQTLIFNLACLVIKVFERFWENKTLILLISATYVLWHFQEVKKVKNCSKFEKNISLKFDWAMDSEILKISRYTLFSKVGLSYVRIGLFKLWLIMLGCRGISDSIRYRKDKYKVEKMEFFWKLQIVRKTSRNINNKTENWKNLEFQIVGKLKNRFASKSLNGN